MHRFWTPEEIELLKRNSHRKRSELTNLLPNRSFYAIKHKLRKLGLVKEYSRWRWTDGEIKLLKKHYSTLSLGELKNKYFPNRSIVAIQTKAWKLGLKKPITFWCGNHGRSSVRTLTTQERYYLAGIIDGEGSIHIGKSGKNFYVAVQIGNTSIKLVETCRKLIGARMKFTERREPNLARNQKPVWIYEIRSRPDVQKLLEQLKDILIVKREQCNLVLRFIDILNHRPKLHEYPKECYEIYAKVKALNHRGISTQS